jgi:thioredoxin 1
MAPILEKVAKKLDETADIVKVNIEESADNNYLASEYEIQSIPSMVVFKHGQEVHRFIGINPESTVTNELQKLSAASLKT